jgi:neutral ceramidase
MNWIPTELLEGCDDADHIVDPEVIVLQIETLAGQLLGFVVNYANHNNAAAPHGSTRSADIAGEMGRILRKIYGDDIVVVFLTGACGNTNWIDFRAEDHRKDPGLYKKLGTSLAGSVLQILARLEYPQIDDVAMVGVDLAVPERPWRDYDTAEDGTFGPEGVFDFITRAREETEGNPLQIFNVPLRALRIGRDIAIATVAGELFAEFGLEIKATSPFRYTLTAELTNGEVGYIPTLEAYDEGGYEVRKPASRMVPDAGLHITAASKQLLQELAGSPTRTSESAQSHT